MNPIKQAAVLTNGVMYTGKRHKDIFINAPKGINIRKGCKEGFVTSAGLFVDRKMAAEIAYQSGQIKNKVDELKSEHIY